MEINNNLFSSLKSGNENAWNEFFNSYHEHICRIAYSIIGDEDVAKDIAIESFKKVHDRISNFKTAPRLCGYLIRTSRNAAIDQYKKAAVKIKAIAELKHTMPVSEHMNHTGKIFGEKENYDELRKAVMELPVKQRNVMVLQYYYGLKIDRVAAIMNIKVSAVYKLNQKAIAKLRKKFPNNNF